MTGHPSTIPADILDTIATMREAGARYQDIARATGLPWQTCGYQAVRLGAFCPGRLRRCTHPPVKIRSGRCVRAFTEVEDQQITAWSLEGITLLEMGRRLGRKHNSVLGRLRTLARREALAEVAV